MFRYANGMKYLLTYARNSVILTYTKNQLKTVQKIEHNLAYMDYAKIFCLQFYWLLVLLSLRLTSFHSFSLRFRSRKNSPFPKIEYDIIELQKKERRKTQMKYKALMVLAAVPIMLTGAVCRAKNRSLLPKSWSIMHWWNGLKREWQTRTSSQTGPIIGTMQGQSDWTRTDLFSRICGRYSVTKISISTVTSMERQS